MSESRPPSIFSLDGCLLTILSTMVILGAIAGGIFLDDHLQPTNGLEKFLKIIIVDFFFTVAAVFVVALAVLMFRPVWLEKLLRTTLQKFFLVFGLMVIGFVTVGIYVFFIEGTK